MIISFLTGIVQVFLVAFQTKQIATAARLWQIVAVGMGISAVWVLNVRAAAGTVYEAVAYVLGAGLGTGLAVSLHDTLKGQKR